MTHHEHPPPAALDLDGVRDLARGAHAGQVDAMGADYYTAHLLPVAARLQHLGERAVMAGLLHDVVEDTADHQDPWNAQRLAEVGIGADVVAAVVACTRLAGEPYQALIARACAHPLGRQVKLADNAHNLAGNDALAAVDPVRAASLRRRYLGARDALLAAGSEGSRVT